MKNRGADIERYRRNIDVAEIGEEGQDALSRSSVTIIGAGGLGSPCALYLAAAGVGRLRLVDDDKVELSNLQRQIIHQTDAVGTSKVHSAANSLNKLNPNVEVRLFEERLTADNALDIISQFDLVADGCDNFDTRFLVNDACFLSARPLVSAAVAQFEGQIATFRAFEKDEDGRPRPSYRCLLPEAPPPGLVPSCEEAGILGALTGVVGAMQAMEVIKEILGLGQSLAGKVMLYDALSASTTIIALPWNPDNPLNGNNPTITDLSAHN